MITFEGFEALREFEYNQVQHAQNYAAKKRDVAEHEMNRIEDTKRGILITVIGWVFLLLFSDRFWIAVKTVKAFLTRYNPLERVCFVCFDNETAEIYQRLLQAE